MAGAAGLRQGIKSTGASRAAGGSGGAAGEALKAWIASPAKRREAPTAAAVEVARMPLLAADMPSFFAKLNPNGRMVAVGAVAGPQPADFAMEMFAAFQKSMSFATFSTDTIAEPDRRAAIAGLFAAASRGELHSVMHELLPLEHAVLAHQKLEAGEVFGRIVLAPAGS